MIYELRNYKPVAGRAADVAARFRDHTSKIWNRLGIEQIGYWTTLVGQSEANLIYMLRWDSLADREVKWAAFLKDPEWLEVRTRTELNGPIVANISNELLTPIDFSALK